MSTQMSEGQPAPTSGGHSQWFVVKPVYEAAATPLTHLVGALQRREGVDVYDRATDFNPLLVVE